MIDVTVAYAMTDRQWLWPVRLPAGATVADAIAACDLRRWLPEPPLPGQPVGIFGKPCTWQTIVRSGDRVELYRPLQCDPKAVRRARAESDRAPGKPR